MRAVAVRIVSLRRAQRLAQPVEFHELRDRPFQRGMAAVNAGVEMAQEDASACESSFPQCRNSQATEAPGDSIPASDSPARSGPDQAQLRCGRNRLDAAVGR